jgi:4-hydroxy-3-polyprenylbenzoate decarboxylase
MNRPIVVAITGASGAVYARRIVEVLVEQGRELHLVVSPSARIVFREELGIDLDIDRLGLAAFGISRAAAKASDATSAMPPPRANVHFHHHQNYMAPIASGSFLTEGMVICPCSGGTLSGVVRAASSNLIERAAEVHLKERRKLILVPRETPLSLPQLDNLKRAAEAGAVVLPAMPGWYHGVKSLQDLIDFVVARILDQLGVEHQLMRRWGEPEVPASTGECSAETAMDREAENLPGESNRAE